MRPRSLPTPGSSPTDREVQVLRLVAVGFTNARIARTLLITPNTVRSHLTRIGARLGESDRAALVRAGFERGLLRLPDAVVLAQAEVIQARRRDQRLMAMHAELARQDAVRGAA